MKFHSGNPFTADDVKFSIERILDPATTATRSKEFSVVQSVTVVNPSTVKITLKKPDAPFLELLAAAEAMIVDKKWAQSGGNFKQATSGTGPFKQGPFEAGVRYALREESRLLGAALSVSRPDRATPPSPRTRSGCRPCRRGAWT